MVNTCSYEESKGESRGFLLTCTFIVLFYGGALCALHLLLPGAREASGDYWGFVGQPFDAPEPNYLVVPWISEFWSVITVFPFAGWNLLRLGLKYGYSPQVLFTYVHTTVMYSTAFFSHMTLHTVIQQITCSLVISNAIVAYLVWGWIAGGPLKHFWFRFPVGFLGWAAMIYGIATFPFILKPFGGVYTLFVVQTPPVLGAFLGAVWLDSHNLGESQALKAGIRCLSVSGFLLCMAMCLSLVEVYYGMDYGVIASLLGFPWMHVVIHILEQIGIYGYGVGSACLHHCYVEPTPCSFKWCGLVPYLALSDASDFPSSTRGRLRKVS